MHQRYSRRQMLHMGLGGLLSLSAFDLVGCSSGVPSLPSLPSPTNTSAGSTSLARRPVSLFMIFWGAATRNTFTREAITLFQQIYPDVIVNSSYSGNDVYYSKLDALVKAHHVPDLIQMGMRSISRYVCEGELLDMTNLISNQSINLSDFNPSLLDSSKVNDTIYGIPLGSTYPCMFYSKTLLKKANIGEIPAGMTWETFLAYTTELSQALGDDIYGTSDNSGDYDNFEIWIRQRGKELYTPDGQLAFALEDVSEWYDYWNKMRHINACIPMKLQSRLDLTQTPTDSSVIKGQAVFSHFFSNQLVSFQQATAQKLCLTIYPIGSTAGIYLKASQLLSISAATRHPEEAAAFISFIINDPGAVKALGFERGVPGSASGLAYLLSLLSPQEKLITHFMAQVANNNESRVKNVLDPPAAGMVSMLLQRNAQDIGNGKQSVSFGAHQFYAAARAAVNQKTV